MKALKVKRAVYSSHIEKAIWSRNKSTAALIRKLAVPALLAASMTANADCKATLVATIGGQPAMKPVAWKVYQGESLITSDNSHSSVHRLPCGEYRITATLGSTTTTRYATLSGPVTLVIELGGQ